jgi:hypothetical protein
MVVLRRFIMGQKSNSLIVSRCVTPQRSVSSSPMKSHCMFMVLYLSLLMMSTFGVRPILRRVPAPMRVNTILATPHQRCLSSHDGYLRARLRRANSDTAQTDIDWADADMECDGEPRPEHRGVRLTFAGLLPATGARVRLVFGIAADPKAQKEFSVRNVPANVTVIFEDERKLYSTAGDGKCTIDQLTVRDTRFVARGFCTEPATVIAGSDTLLVERFDFAGLVRDEDIQ